ncbi:MAG: UDP-N-acetylmuramoyl-tripeptide--D-alanyl-D-alanine ligase, partial [Candidatus Latescibacterota bacterium]
RSKIYRGCGIVLIDDSYNANPTSMRAALEVLGRISLGRKIAVLGDMAELGEFSDDAHRELGAHLSSVPVDIVYWLGANGGLVKEGIAGRKPIKTFDRLDALVGELEPELKPDDVVLVKASRSCHLDKIVDRLLETVLKEED